MCVGWPLPAESASASLCSRDRVFFFLARVVGESVWKTLETHSSKTNTVLKVLKPDTTYQVKVQVQCLSKVHNTNEFVTLRTPEGCKCYRLFSWRRRPHVGFSESPENAQECGSIINVPHRHGSFVAKLHGPA